MRTSHSMCDFFLSPWCT